MENIDNLAKKTATFDPTYAASIHKHKRKLEKEYVISQPFLGELWCTAGNQCEHARDAVGLAGKVDR